MSNGTSKGKMWMALFAASSLVLGAGLAFGAASESSEYGKKPEASKAATAPATPESKQMKPASGMKEKAAHRIVRGTVTAVEPSASPATLTVKAMQGKQEEVVGVDVPTSAKITEGKAMKTLADIQVGDRVWMRYDRTSDKLVADSIRILKKPAQASAKKASAEKATPAATKTEGSK